MITEVRIVPSEREKKDIWYSPDRKLNEDSSTEPTEGDDLKKQKAANKAIRRPEAVRRVTKGKVELKIKVHVGSRVLVKVKRE